MSKTYEPIATASPSAASSVQFTNIPNTYTDLVIVYQLTHSTGDQDVRVRFNSDTGSNYSWTLLSGSGTAAVSTQASSQTSAWLDGYGYPGTTESAMSVVQIFSYANTNVNKTLLSESRRAGNGLDQLVALWRSTNAITAITLFTNSGTITGTVSLYGIKAESPVLPLLTESTKTTSSVSAIISNYDAGLTYTVASTAGTATRSGNTVTVSGLTEAQNITLTVTATDGNNSSSSNTISLTSLAVVISGGTETTSGGYKIHTFNSSGTLTVSNGSKTVEYLIVSGGGGSGGNSQGDGGGGAGGLDYKSSFVLTQGSHTITIGAGGSQSQSGNNSSIGSRYTLGGGRGGQFDAGGSGGSGGGGGATSSTGFPGGVTYPIDVSQGGGSQGNSGGSGLRVSTSSIAGGGGGGAGGAGGSAYNYIGYARGGTGGSGATYNISGSSVTYASGGGGSGNFTGDGPLGAGGANTGNGAGGPAYFGGSGVVIIRYPV